MIAGLQAMQQWSGEAELASIASPTMVCWGDLDRSYSWFQIEQLWRAIPQCNLAVIPNCAHAVHGEQPGLFNSVINSFLKAKS